MPQSSKRVLLLGTLLGLMVLLYFFSREAKVVESAKAEKPRRVYKLDNFVNVESASPATQPSSKSMEDHSTVAKKKEVITTQLSSNDNHSAMNKKDGEIISEDKSAAPKGDENVVEIKNISKFLRSRRHGNSRTLEVLYTGKWKAVAPLDEQGYFKVPKGVDRVVMEVGTNDLPDYLPDVTPRPEVLYIMVEPVVVDKATEKCRTLKDRCIMWPAAAFVRETTTVFNVALFSQCSSILAQGTGCAKIVDKRVVSLLTLDTMLSFVPPHLHFELLALDCQGTDLLAAAGLRKYRDRVAYLMLECQDLPLWHSEFISPGGYSCGQAISCLRENWQDWSWKECMPNIGPREFNCIAANTKHKFTTNATIKQPKPSWRRTSPSAPIVFEETCPVLFVTGEGAPGNEDPPRTIARAPLACDKQESRQVLEARFPKLPCDAKMWRNISLAFDALIANANREVGFYQLRTACANVVGFLRQVLGVSKNVELVGKITSENLPSFVLKAAGSCFNFVHFNKPLLR